MIKLLIGNSISKVSGLTSVQLKEIRKLMSYVNTQGVKNFKQRGRMSWKSDRIYIMTERGVFPTGLLYILANWVTQNGLDVDVQDSRVCPEPRKDWPQSTFPFKPYPEQLEAAEALAEAHRGIVSATTGFGKSAVIALVIDALKVKTLVVVPSLNLKQQLTDDLRGIFGKKSVGPLRDKPLIAVENVDALNKDKELVGYHSVIIDEYHHAASTGYLKLNINTWNSVYHRIGVTATPFRSKSEERLLLESILAEIVYKVTYKKAVEKGYVCPLEAYWVEIPEVKPAKGRKKTSYTSYHKAYSDLITNNEAFHEIVASIGSRLQQDGTPTLILTKQVAHGAAIQELMGVDIPFVKGENEDNSALIRDFNSLETPVIIGTEGCLGEGVDSKSCEYILDAGGGKAKSRFMQKVGRALRRFKHPIRGDKPSGKLIMFRYRHNKWLESHFNDCVKHLKDEYGIVPTELKVS